jgi:hypothetical protein
MKPRVCICCGESIPEPGNALSRNPNVCASCSSLADGMEDPITSDLAQSYPDPVHEQSAREVVASIEEDPAQASAGLGVS